MNKDYCFASFSDIMIDLVIPMNREFGKSLITATEGSDSIRVKCELVGCSFGAVYQQVKLKSGETTSELRASVFTRRHSIEAHAGKKITAPITTRMGTKSLYAVS